MIKVIPLSSLVKVFSDNEPTQKAFDRLSCMRNEKVQLQVAFCSREDSEININAKSDFGDCLNMYWVEEIYSKNPVHTLQEDYTLRKKSGYFPELLRPLDGVFIAKAGKWNSVWIEIIPKTAYKVGENKINVSFASGENIEKAEFTIEVIGADLPEQTLINTNWFHSDCIAVHYGIEVFSDKYWEYVQNFLQVAHDYGMNMVLTPLFTPPLDTKIGGERPTVQLVVVDFTNGV